MTSQPPGERPINDESVAGGAPDNFLAGFLSDPEILGQVQPLLNAAIDARVAPIVAQLEQLTQGVTLIAQATVESAQAAQPPAPQPQPQQPAPIYAPPPQFGGGQNGTAPPPPFPAQQQPAAVDKLAAFAPLLMQYLSGQQGNNSLGNIAETLSAAAQIGNVMNQPMFSGMKMATDMMSMAGRAGIEPHRAAETLGGMIDAQNNLDNGSGNATAG